jgi:cytochrome c-type biogenesis protein CcmH/NrfG
MREIVAELWENAEQLIRNEVALTLSEVERKSERLKTEIAHEATAAAIGGAVIFAGGLAFVAAAVLLLCKAVEPWLAALIVGAVASVSGYALLQRRTHVAHTSLAPTQATASVQHSVRSIKEAVHDAARSR